MTKRALLIGCNYPGTNAELRGCVNDVKSINAMLLDHFGFEPGNIHIQTDIDNSTPQPTGKNIKDKLSELVKASKDGDILVFHFSGHGTQISDDNDEEDGKDEAICPTDMNLICDDDLRDIIQPLPDGVHFTMISDCCHSGSMLDHPEQQIAGDKDPNAPPGGSAMPMDALMGMFGLKELPSNQEVKNRGLSENMFCKVFSAINGKDMQHGNVRSMLTKTFGDESSKKVLGYAKQLNDYLVKSGMAKKAGNQGKAAGMLQKMLGMCLAQASSANEEPDLDVKPPKPGTKPPAGERLSDDKGILITGCQSHETSADACPSGDASKAFGALTNALTTCVKATKQNDPNATITYKQLVQDVRATLLKTGFKQNPCLECSDKNAGAVFLC